MIRLLFALALLAVTAAFAADSAPAADPRLAAVLPAKLDRTYTALAAERSLRPRPRLGRHARTAAYAHTGAPRPRQRRGKNPATRATRFRIASMTKSFTALAVYLQLRRRR